MKGRYFLDEINGETFSTNSYETYILYLKIFYWDEYQRVMYPYKPDVNQELSGKPANHETYLNALREIYNYYDNGYVPERIITKKGWHKTIWIKNHKKAKRMLNKSKVARRLFKDV